MLHENVLKWVYDSPNVLLIVTYSVIYSAIYSATCTFGR